MKQGQDHDLPRVLADLPLGKSLLAMLLGRVELLPWEAARRPGADGIAAV